MAVDTKEVSLRISAVNEASKPLAAARADLDKLEDAVKAYGVALDEHKGSPREFATAMSAAFKPLPGIAKETVGKIGASLDELNAAIRETDSAMEFGAKQIDIHHKNAEAIQAEADAVRDKIKAEDDAKQAAKDVAKVEKDAIDERLRLQKKAVRDIVKLANDEQRVHDAIDKRLIKNRRTLEEGTNLTPKRRATLDQKSIEDARLLEESRARAALLAQEREAANGVLSLMEREKKANADLTESITRESKKRVEAHEAEERAIKNRLGAQQRALKAAQNDQDVLETRRAGLGAEAAELAAVRDRALRLQASAADPVEMRRAASGIGDAPGRQARGMTLLAAETRRAAEAQRLLTGEVKRGAAGFNSAKSYVMGLVSAYAIYATAISQASKAIDAYKAKEAFQITVGNTMGGDMERAGAEFRYLTDTANEYGFAISAISQEYAKLAATARGIGRTDKEIRTLFEGVLSVARVNALSDEKVQDAFRAITQIISKNQVMSEELKGQLAEALPGAVVGFAASQGYGPERMKEFAKALEEGKFATRDIIEYAEAELAKNADAVKRAGDTFAAVMARFQNTLFKARGDFAEGAFMDGLKDTIQELDEFFKSDDGRAYMLRLGEAANVVVGALGWLARNLDKVAAVVGLLGAAKLGSLLTRWGAGAIAAAGGLTAAAGAATGAAGAMTLLGVAMRGVIGLLGGPLGAALVAAGAAWSIFAHRGASKTAELQSGLDTVQSYLDDVGSAAINAGGDLAKFRKELESIDKDGDALVASNNVIRGLRSKTEFQAAQVRAIVEFNRTDFADLSDVFQAGEQFSRIVEDANSGTPTDKIKERVKAWREENEDLLASVVGLDKVLDEFLGTAAQLSTQFDNRDSIIAIESGDVAALTKEMERHNQSVVNLTEANTLAAEAEKKLEEGIADALDAAGDPSGMREYDEAMRKAQDTKKSLIKDLEAWIEAEKAAGRAVPAEEVKRRTDEIAQAHKEMADTAAGAWQRMRSEAAGMTVALTDAAAQAIAAKRAMDSLSRTSLDPMGAFPSYGAGQENLGPQGRAGMVRSLSKTESGGRWHLQNSEGYAGRLQFGDARLNDYKRATGESFTKEQFRQDPDLQMRVEQWHLEDLENQVRPYVGQSVSGRKMTMCAMVGMAHLGGTAGAIRHVRTNGAYDPADSNGTRRSDYARTHANGYAVPGTMGSATLPSSYQSQVAGTTPQAQQALATLLKEWGDLKVISGHRDAGHNAKVGGAKGSEHINGNAYDVSVRDMPVEERKRLIVQARASGFRGVGVYDNSLHFDTGADRAWGPDYTRQTLPDWAKDVVGSPVGQAFQARTEETAINIARTLAKDFSDQSMDVLDQFFIKLPQELTEPMEDALAAGDAGAVADLMRQAGEESLANQFLEKDLINQQTKAAEDAQEAIGSVREIVEGAEFSDDELTNGAARAAAIERETAKAVREITANGTTLNRAMGTETDADALSKVRSEVSREADARWGDILKEQEKERAQAARERVMTDEQSLRNAQQRAELAKIENEEARARQEIMYRLANEEADGQFTRTAAERNALVEAEMRAWNAENAERLAKEREDEADKAKSEAEKVHAEKIALLQARLAQLQSQLADAIQAGDVSAQNRLTGEISSTADELVRATQAAGEFYKKLGGHEGEMGRISVQNIGDEAAKAKQKLGEMTPEAQRLASTIQGHLNGAVSSFAEAVAQGQDPWKALAASVGQAVGQILVDIGKMVVEAAIAKAVMRSMGLTPAGATIPAGQPGAGGNFLGQAIGFFGNLIGGIHHDGGVVGDPSKRINFLGRLMNLRPGERPIIALDGEEMLTRKDPRHRLNLGESIKRMTRFHTGGVIGSLPDPAGLARAASGAGAQAVSRMAAAAAAPEVRVENHNYIDPEEMFQRALSAPSGVKVLMNAMSQNRHKFRGVLG